jgi:transposase
MISTDARSLPAAAQEALRRRVVAALEGGMNQAQAARVFGVSRQSVNAWWGRYQEAGTRALKAQKRGRPAEPALSRPEAARAKRLIRDRCPDQLKLPFALWTRPAVCELLKQHFGLEVSVWTAGRYLAAWGFTPQKPLRRAYEQDRAEVRAWLREEYPAIAAQAKRDGALIHWGDEMGLRSDHQAGTSYGIKGQTPVVPGTGQRFGCNMISAITNRGELSFMVFRQRFTAAVFVVFLARLLRLVRSTGRGKVFLIVDGHPVHRSAKAQRWVAAHAQDLRLFLLPGYSPELNPDELLNQDVKTNAAGRRRPKDQPEMIANVRGYLRSTQRQPGIVRSYFQEEHVCYAAA